MPGKKRPTSDGAPDRYGGLTSHGSTEGLSFSAGKEGLLPRAVDSILSVGDAVLLARTSDGGALVIRPIHDGLSNPIYAASPQELDEALVAIVNLPT